MPSKELQIRFRRWGLVADTEITWGLDDIPYIELSLTLIGREKQTVWTPLDTLTNSHPTYTGHTFRSALPKGFVPKPDCIDPVWLSIMSVCQEKLLLRTFQRVRRIPGNVQIEGRMKRIELNNLAHAKFLNLQRLK